MKRFLIVLIGLAFYDHCYCQVDCNTFLKNYPNTIDTSKRPVYRLVDNMPEILTNSKLLEFFATKIHLIDSSKCFPIYISYGFVVEADSSISNIMICPTLMFCDDYEKVDLVEQKYIKLLTDEIQKIKTNVGFLNGKSVAVFTLGRIHNDPQRDE
jgi:hypothetical protein